jgi:hypothetical protein
MAHVGAPVREGETVLRVHHRRGRGLGDAAPLLAEAVQIGDAPPSRRPIVIDRVGAS